MGQGCLQTKFCPGTSRKASVIESRLGGGRGLRVAELQAQGPRACDRLRGAGASARVKSCARNHQPQGTCRSQAPRPACTSGSVQRPQDHKTWRALSLRWLLSLQAAKHASCVTCRLRGNSGRSGLSGTRIGSRGMFRILQAQCLLLTFELPFDCTEQVKTTLQS